MEIKSIVKLIETLGIPLAVALCLGNGLWKLIQFLLKDLKTDIAGQQDDLLQALRGNQTMIIKLIDRVRTLEINQMTAYTSLLTAARADLPDWRRTRAERIAELNEQIKDISHNGEEGEQSHPSRSRFPIPPARNNSTCIEMTPVSRFASPTAAGASRSMR